MRRAGLALVLIIFSFAVPAASATPAHQQDNDLTTPLLTANNCGDGSGGETQFTIAATGDTFPHENIQAVGEAQGYDYLFDQLRPFLKAADLAYTNFDGAMLAGAGYSGYPAFNYNPALAAALKNAGIGLVSTANNHILDRGPEGLDATMRVLDEAGIRYHGTVASGNTSAPRPPFLKVPVTREGITVTLGFVSASWGTNGIPDTYNQVNPLFESNAYGADSPLRQNVLDAVAQAKRETDLVVVAAHWGVEYQFFPNHTQVDAAQKLAAAGADIILGAQPHTLQPVDVIDSNGRKTLVIYSLANFLASQGAFQAESYSATSVVFYIGIARAADGTARVTGYRYLPTIHIDNDTRPAPIPAQGYESVIAHVRAEMRDPSGSRQLDADRSQLGQRVEICPRYSFAEAPEKAVSGDFATLYTQLGASAPVSHAEAVAVLGLPLWPVRREQRGDCTGETTVLYTPYQRLEWHPETAWPYRVVGTQLGTAAYAKRYNPAHIQRADASALADPAFRAFYERYGGAAVFGLPISGQLQENSVSVQYLERARFEQVSGVDTSAPLIAQVRLGRLTDTYAGIAAQCHAAPTLIGSAATANAANQPLIGSHLAPNGAPAQPSRGGSVLWLAVLLIALSVGLGVIWLAFQRASVPRVAARVRERQLHTTTRALRVAQRVPPLDDREQSPQPDAVRPQQAQSDEDVLRGLLGF